jgi:DNA-directed RNA polymerase subunit RPC12/RpoP
MEFVVIACGRCGAAVRIRQPNEARRHFCPRCGTELLARPWPVVAFGWVAGMMIGALAGVLIVTCWALWPRPSETLRAADSPALLCHLARATTPPLVPQPPEETPTAPSQVVHHLAAKVADRSVSVTSGEVLLAMRKAEEQNSEVARGRSGDVPGVVNAPSTPPRTGSVLVRQVSARREEPVPSDRPDSAGPFKIRDENGQPAVARLHGRWADKTVLILPDGQLGLPNMLIPTSEPFRPLTADELLPRLQQGPLGSFQVFRTSHYLIFYKSSQGFAEASGRLLEDLYRRLLDAFRKNQVPVHEAEFPLVAVIYRTEREFRASHAVEPVVQAFYETYTNRITFYEISDQDESAPEISALRKPQTVAHEGTHQILQNIGVHPRLSSWPIWLVEGLAEYCATPATARKGGKPTWDGLGMINGLHMATIRELDDPVSLKVEGDNSPAKSLVREPGKPLVECLVRKTRLTPTEYSLAWAMTHYLAFKRQDEFIAFLKTMSELPPLEPRTPEDHLAEFESAFGHDLVKLDRAIDTYLRKLDAQKRFDRMPFYAVMYEQVIPTGLVRRARVSQSPQVIWQWVQEVTVPQGHRPTWQAIPHDTRGRAMQAVQEWMKGPG